MKNNILSDFFELQIRQSRKIIGHVSCSLINGEIVIKDLYVLKRYRGRGFGDVLLYKVNNFAKEKLAAKIVAYCGAEPFCEDGQVPLNEEKQWYENHGFLHDHDVMGVTPCMIKLL